MARSGTAQEGGGARWCRSDRLPRIDMIASRITGGLNSDVLDPSPCRSARVNRHDRASAGVSVGVYIVLRVTFALAFATGHPALLFILEVLSLPADLFGYVVPAARDTRVGFGVSALVSSVLWGAGIFSLIWARRQLRKGFGKAR